MQYNFIQKTTLRVRYGETDQMGYCYYGNYAQYFEVGRVEALRTIGMNYRDLEESGIMLPVSEFHVNYHSPAKYDDELIISTKITSIIGPRIVFDYEISNESGKLISSASTTLVFVKKETMRPTAPVEEFIKLLEPFIQSDEQ